MRVCRKCWEAKDLSEFYRHSCGYRHTCKSCTKSSVEGWAKFNPERRNEIVRKSRKNPNNEWQKYRNEWRRQSGETAKRRASLDYRIPAWLSEDDHWLIREVYALRALRQKTTGIKWHVDHIIPLHGKDVSGLHVPTNLQVIPERVNLKKGNKYGQLSKI